MKQIIVVIKDKLIGCGSLMSFPNAESAIRSFKEVMNGDNQMAKYPEDHELIALGGYDTEKGEITALPETRVLTKGKDVSAKGNLAKKSMYPEIPEAMRPEVRAKD